MLKAETVERDENGFWCHSALASLQEGDRIDKHPDLMDSECAFIDMESNASDELNDRYVDGKAGAEEWTPTPPDGEGWVLLAIYDTEDGPYACFARPNTKAEAAK